MWAGGVQNIKTLHGSGRDHGRVQINQIRNRDSRRYPLKPKVEYNPPFCLPRCRRETALQYKEAGGGIFLQGSMRLIGMFWGCGMGVGRGEARKEGVRRSCGWCCVCSRGVHLFCAMVADGREEILAISLLWAVLSLYVSTTESGRFHDICFFCYCSEKHPSAPGRSFCAVCLLFFLVRGCNDYVHTCRKMCFYSHVMFIFAAWH